MTHNTPENNLVPVVVARDSNGERAMDIYSMLLQNRIIDMSSGFDAKSSSLLRSSLLYLQNKDKNKPIHLYIDSPGGSVLSGLAVLDTMRTITPKVNVYCVGTAASMGSIILAGATGTRYLLPHSQVMLHQVSSGSKGQVEDMIINTVHAKNLDIDIQRLFGRITGRTRDEIVAVMNRDSWFTAQQAIDFGLADKIVDLSHEYTHTIDENDFPYVSIN